VGALCYIAASGATSSKGLLHLLFVNGRTPKRSFSSKSSAFTVKDRAIMEVLSHGFLYKEIADKLGLNIGNLKRRLHDIYKKLEVCNRTEAIEVWRGFEPDTLAAW
jgi:DNA-binding NarL/FixJ family response regulator